MLMDISSKRTDGRKEDDIRPIFMKAKVVTKANGSAYLEMQKTKVICAVYGPRQIPKKQDVAVKGLVTCEFKFAPFACPRGGQPQDNEEKEMSLFLKQALEPAVCLHTFPNARLDVNISVLENDGNALAAAITCAGIALADSGIEMFDSVIGCSLIGDDSLLDPLYEEEIMKTESNHGLVTLSYMPNRHQITSLQHSGKLNLSTLEKIIETLRDACNRIYPVVKDCLIENFIKQED